MWQVHLKIQLMGRQCKSCSSTYMASVAAESAEEAVAIAKVQSGADPGYHKFTVVLVKFM